MSVITLLTDFGLQDGFAGVLKGVIWKIAPHVQIADISHSIKPQDIYHGAIALWRTARYFPAGTIHVAVVDPGVGTDRRPVGLRVGAHYFIGPDNGLFTLVIEEAESHAEEIKVFHLDRSEYWLPEVSNVFHGRDIFAPMAAHLALGIKLEQMGIQIIDPNRLKIPRPELLVGGGWCGQVIEIDTFGNLATNIAESHLLSLGEIIVQVAGRQISGLVNTFGDCPPGSLIALYGTSHDLIIAIVNGNAARTLNASIGDLVEVIPTREAS